MVKNCLKILEKLEKLAISSAMIMQIFELIEFVIKLINSNITE